MQYKVPQNIDIEDQVIGSLTLRQFMILLTAAGIDLLIFFLVPELLRPLAWILIMVTTGLAVVLGFVKYGDQNLEIFLISTIETFKADRLRVWRKEFHPEAASQAEKIEAVKTDPKKKSLQEVRGNLEQLAELVDSGGLRNYQPQNTVVGTGIIKENIDAPDLLTKAENGSPIVDQIISKVKVIKKEPLISEVASVSPAKTFEYPSIKKTK